MSWLIILQLFTIAFAYFISENYVGNSSEKLNKVDDKYGKGCISFFWHAFCNHASSVFPSASSVNQNATPLS